MPTATPHDPAPTQLVFVRHGATAPNLEGLRCGGDLDVPLTEVGRAQASMVALLLRGRARRIGVIVTSDLQRTRATAEIIAAVLGGVPVIVEPAFRERALGSWNRMPIELTEPWFRERRTPPGGEADAEFVGRIGRALPLLLPLLPQQPLLVSSKGVGRALGELLGQPGHAATANAGVAEFDLARLGASLNLQPLAACPA